MDCEGERAVELLSRAKDAGFKVSRRQLARWHASGLLPRPLQLQSSGVAGSETIYPTGTSAQLIALCNLRAKNRRLSDLGWCLWMLGFDVREAFWKDRLKNVAAWHDKISPVILRVLRPENNKNFLVKLIALRTRNVLFRQLRKRVGTSNFESLVGLIGRILDGSFDGWTFANDSSDDDLIRDKLLAEKALGLNRFKSAEQIVRNPRAHDVVEEVLIMLSARLSGTIFAEMIAKNSDDQIASARNELRGLLAVVSSTTGPDASGLKAIAQFASKASNKTQMVMLLYFLGLKEDPNFQKSLDDFFERGRSTFSPDLDIEIVRSLHRTDPALAEIFFPGNAHASLKI